MGRSLIGHKHRCHFEPEDRGLILTVVHYPSWLRDVWNFRRKGKEVDCQPFPAPSRLPDIFHTPHLLSILYMYRVVDASQLFNFSDDKNGVYDIVKK